MTPTRLISARARELVAIVAALLAASRAPALFDPKDPNLTLYEHAQGAKPNPPAMFPDLKQDSSGYWMVDFRHLASFIFDPSNFPPQDDPNQTKGIPFFQEDNRVPDAGTSAGSVDRIPRKVRALDGKRIVLKGFMLPTAEKDGLTREFLIIRSQLTCCFGIPPAPNEWVVVKMPSKGVQPQMDIPLSFYGTLHVGEMYEQGTFVGVYRLDCERVSAD